MIYSHPQRLLTDHLRGVEKTMLDSFEDMSLDTEKAFGISKENFRSLITSIALSHDIGKATKLFQKKLKNPKIRVSHSPISSVYAYVLAKNSLRSVSEEFRTFLSFCAFAVVRRHHGFLIRPMDEIADTVYNKENLVKFTNYIQPEFVKWFEENTKVSISRHTTEKALEELENVDEKVHDFLDSKKDLSSYFILNILYSLLIDADRIDAATYGKNKISRTPINHKAVEEYVRTAFGFPSNYVEKMRNTVRIDVESNENIKVENHVYTITLPTGGGKTLTSFSAAFRLKEIIEKRRKNPVRIIYTLPFTSLIDQNSDVIKKLLKNSHEKITSDIFLVQHHLAPNDYTTKENESLSPDISSLFISSWNSEIIATTFVSLFNGIITNRRSEVRKLHNVIGSILILDEIQNIPHEYWPVLNEVFEFMAKKLDTYFIFVTATQPKIIRNAVELVPNPSKWFEKINRVELIPKMEEITEFEKLFDNTMKELDNGKRVMVVFNTIYTAQTFFKMFDKTKIKKKFLSSGIIPVQRKKTFEELKDPNNVSLLVSTQVVEAGMELDFDCVYRDIAPLDSIVQSCGRCNRNFKKNVGKVYVFNLKDENGKSYSNLVYDKVLLEISKEVLDKRKSIFEKQFLSELIIPYFEGVYQRTCKATADEYISSMKNLVYSRSNLDKISISDFSIIKKFMKAPVYIQYDDKAVELWKEFEEMEELEPKEWYEKSKVLFKRMNEYMISVNVTNEFLENAPPFFDSSRGKSFYIVEKGNMKSFYDEEIGFYLKNKGALII